MTTPSHTRLLYLRAIPVGSLLLLLAVPGFVVLAVLKGVRENESSNGVY